MKRPFYDANKLRPSAPGRYVGVGRGIVMSRHEAEKAGFKTKAGGTPALQDEQTFIELNDAERAGVSLGVLHLWTRAGMFKAPWGKFKGKTIYEIGSTRKGLEYLVWLRNRFWANNNAQDLFCQTMDSWFQDERVKRVLERLGLKLEQAK